MKRLLFLVLLYSSQFTFVNLSCAVSWTINDAVQTALEHNPQALAAEGLVEEARGEARASLSFPSPRVFARYDDIPSKARLADYEERRLGVSQRLEFPLRYIWMSKAAALEVDYSRGEGQALLLDLETDVRLAYLEAWSYTEQVKILTAYNDSLATYYTTISEISEMGGISKIDARKARIKALEAENEAKAAQRLLQTALYRLSALTGHDLTGIELVSPWETDPLDTVAPGIPDLFPFNPELSAAEADLHRLGCEKTLAQTSWLPELELTYFKRYDEQPGDPDTWAFQVELAFPLWYWWGGFGEIKASKARFNRAEAALSSLQLEVSTEYSMLLQETKSAWESLSLYQTEVMPLAMEEYQTVYNSLHLSNQGYIDLIDAQDDLKDAQLANMDLLYDLYEKKISLDRLQGRSIVGDKSMKLLE